MLDQTSLFILGIVIIALFYGLHHLILASMRGSHVWELQQHKERIERNKKRNAERKAALNK